MNQAIGRQRRQVGSGTLEVADKVSVTVGGTTLTHEIPLARDHLTDAATGGGYRQRIDSIEKLFTAQPAKFIPTHRVRQQLVAISLTVCGNNLTCFLLGHLQLVSVTAAVLHAERVVEVNANHRGARMQGLSLAGEGGLGKGQHQKDNS